MATKSKKNTIKAVKRGSPKRTNKKTKAAPQNKNIIVEESKGVYTMSTAPSDVNEQITDSVTTTEANVTNAISTQPTTVEEDKKVDNSDLLTENVSYNNMVVPQAKDNTILYIGAALGAIVLLTILFL